jgi:hypothetical protein
VLADFKQVLARIQSDYGFYVDCQTNPAVALAGYDLTPDERSALSDPVKLGDLLRGAAVNPVRLTVTISGKHDWVNRTRPKKKPSAMADVGSGARISTEVEAVRTASTDAERTAAAVRLIEQIG